MPQRSDIVSFLLIFAFVVSVPLASAQTGNQADTAAVRQKVGELSAGGGKKIVVKLKDGREMKGIATEVSADDFNLRDKKGTDMRVRFDGVAKVRKDGLSRGAAIGIGVAVGVGVFFAASLLIGPICSEIRC